MHEGESSGDLIEYLPDCTGFDWVPPEPLKVGDWVLVKKPVNCESVKGLSWTPTMDGLDGNPYQVLKVGIDCIDLSGIGRFAVRRAWLTKIDAPKFEVGQDVVSKSGLGIFVGSLKITARTYQPDGWKYTCGDMLIHENNIQPAPPKPTYRPWDFDTMPLAVKVKSKKGPSRFIAIPHGDVCCTVGLGSGVKYQELFDRYTQLDGTPCGVEVKS